MKKPKIRTTIRAIGVGLGLAALPFAFQSGDANIDDLPVLKMSQACAQGGGKCVFELHAICTSDGSANYNHYYQP